MNVNLKIISQLSDETLNEMHAVLTKVDNELRASHSIGELVCGSDGETYRMLYVLQGKAFGEIVDRFKSHGHA